MLLQASRSHLLIVDTQERLIPAVSEPERVIRHETTLLAAAGRLGVPVTVVEEYPEGLGPTVASVASALPRGSVTLRKICFSGAAEPAVAERIAELRGQGRDQLVIAGMEAHVCVLQTALGFKAEGLSVAVVGDAVSSRSPHSVSAACARLLHAGCQWVTTEMVVFEWLERAGTEEFRALSALVKAP
jgi:nicotinamidase-related amidase